MNSGRTVFSELMDFLPLKEFRRCVERYNGNHYVKSFSCSDQFLCMGFVQLSYRESLRDIESCLRATYIKVMPSQLDIEGRIILTALYVIVSIAAYYTKHPKENKSMPYFLKMRNTKLGFLFNKDGTEKKYTKIIFILFILS